MKTDSKKEKSIRATGFSFYKKTEVRLSFLQK